MKGQKTVQLKQGSAHEKPFILPAIVEHNMRKQEHCFRMSQPAKEWLLQAFDLSRAHVYDLCSPPFTHLLRLAQFHSNSACVATEGAEEEKKYRRL